MSANRKLANRFRPNFEPLENRDMMSVTSVTLNAGVLHIELDGADDSVRISEISVSRDHNALLPGPIVVSDLTHSITVADLTHPGATWTFDRSSVQKIEVNNNRSYGDVNTIISTSNLPTVIDLRNSKSTNHVETGNGNDTAYGSDGNDFFWTKGGNDMIAAGLGNDFIDGGLGSDTMFGGADNDKLTDAFSPTDANLMYGDAGNDTLLSFCKNDVVDGGADIDTASVKTGTSIVRNNESVFITDVPLGKAVTDTRLTARDAANRYLQAYGLPIITKGHVVNDSKYGLTPSSLVSLIREVKPDAKLVSSASKNNIITVLKTGKPVIAQYGGKEWVVITGFDSVTQKFTFIGAHAQQGTTSLDLGKRAIIY